MSAQNLTPEKSQSWHKAWHIAVTHPRGDHTWSCSTLGFQEQVLLLCTISCPQIECSFLFLWLCVCVCVCVCVQTVKKNTRRVHPALWSQTPCLFHHKPMLNLHNLHKPATGNAFSYLLRSRCAFFKLLPLLKSWAEFVFHLRTVNKMAATLFPSSDNWNVQLLPFNFKASHGCHVGCSQIEGYRPEMTIFFPAKEVVSVGT